MKLRESHRIDAGFQKFESILIVVFVHLVAVYVGCLHSKGAVHHHRKTLMSFYEVFLLYYTDVVEKLLRTTNRKGRNYEIAASVESVLDNLGQLLYIIRFFRMRPVSVGRFAYDIICIRRGLRRMYQWFIDIAEVSEISADQVTNHVVKYQIGE